MRPRRSAEAYAKIWTDKGSPLRVLSEALAGGMQAELSHRCPGPVQVALAMRYGRPDVASTIAQLQREGVRRLLVLPLYPQYSATSTGSVIDAVADALKGLRWPPELRIVNDYHADPGYLDALAASVRAHWEKHGRGERLLLSFHGIPERYHARRRPLLLPVPGHGAPAAPAPGPGRGRAAWSASSRASAASAGCTPTPTPPCASWAPAAWARWTCCAPVSPSTAWRRWRKWRCRTATSSSPPAARRCATSRR